MEGTTWRDVKQELVSLMSGVATLDWKRRYSEEFMDYD